MQASGVAVSEPAFDVLLLHPADSDLVFCALSLSLPTSYRRSPALTIGVPSCRWFNANEC